MNKTFDVFFDNNEEVNDKLDIVEDKVLDNDELREIISNELNTLSSMDVTEYTLYNKWLEVNTDKWSNSGQYLETIKNNIWCPEDLQDYQNLEPEIVLADTNPKNKIWNSLRTFTSTMPWRQGIGRCIRCYIVDRPTGMYLGTFSVASDFMSLGGRDRYIKWTQENKIKDKRLNHTGMCTTLVPTQPLGFNYVGGKLITLLSCSNVLENIWNSKYPQSEIVGLTTTSLYGGGSQYNRLTNWKKLKSTEGTVALEPTDKTIALIREWAKKHYPDDFARFRKQSRPKYKLIVFCYSKLGLKTPKNKAPRGTYWCPLFKNTEAFLRNEVNFDGKGDRKFDNDINMLVEHWKTKFASKRIANIIKNDRYNPENLFYADLIGMTWGEVKEKYLSQVGR